MPMETSSLISKLRKIAVSSPEEEVEKCNLCGRILPEDHRHLVDLSQMKFMCACEMCMITAAEEGLYKPLPQRFLQLENFKIPDELWSDFLIPVNMAFFVASSSRNGTVAYYPAPTGATESKLKMEPWIELEKLNPILNSLIPDLEALIVNRLEDSGQYYIIPIVCIYQSDFYFLSHIFLEGKLVICHQHNEISCHQPTHTSHLKFIHPDRHTDTSHSPLYIV